MAETGLNMAKIPLFFTPGGQNMQLRNESHKITKVFHILYDKMQIFIILIFFQSGSPPKLLKCVENGQNFTFLPLAVLGQRPTTDILHVLACVHGPRLVTCSTGVGHRPTPEPPAGAKMFWPHSVQTFYLCISTYYYVYLNYKFNTLLFISFKFI